MNNRDGTPMLSPVRHVLATDKVRHVGEAVAGVIAESVAAAKDAAEAVVVEIDPLPAVTEPAPAAAPGAPLLYDDVPGNVGLDFHYGDSDKVAAAFAAAAHVTRLELRNNRIVVNPMEPRAALARIRCRAAALDAACRLPGRVRLPQLHRPGARRRARQGAGPDRPGRRLVRHEAAELCRNISASCMRARELGRPVKWTDERSGSFVSDTTAATTR